MQKTRLKISDKIFEYLSNKDSLELKSDHNSLAYCSDFFSSFFGFSRKKFYRSLHKMQSAQYIKFSRNNRNIPNISLTEKGIIRYKKIYLNNIKIKKTKKWDKKWRVVCFDIPEKLKKVRKSFYKKIKDLGFFKLQNSVYIFPFECKKEMESLINFLNIKEYVDFFETHSFNKEEKLKKYFKIH